MTVAAISGVFHRCYVIESLRPELKENTPPSINTEELRPSVYSITEVEVDSTDLNPPIVTFEIGEVFDPDPETKLRGRSAVDYPGYGPADRVVEFDLGREPTDRTLWSGEVKYQIITTNFPVGKTYTVIVGISDKEWEATNNWFAVPDNTQAAFARWVIKPVDNVIDVVQP
jgi:hypothetical protein